MEAVEIQTLSIIIVAVLFFTIAILLEILLIGYFSRKHTEHLEVKLGIMYHLIKDLEKLLLTKESENQNLKLKRENVRQKLEIKTYKNKEKSLTNKKEFKKQRKKRGAIN